MSTSAPPTHAPRRQPTLARVASGPAPARRVGNSLASSPVSTPPKHRARTLFRVPFASAMSDADIAVLTRELDLTTHMHPKLHDSPVRPGVTRVDFYSGLFLERDANKRVARPASHVPGLR